MISRLLDSVEVIEFHTKKAYLNISKVKESMTMSRGKKLQSELNTKTQWLGKIYEKHDGENEV
jgi:hypothetical protein